ncbi:MAG: hypothetical protein ABSC94_33395 [Polyangiaceae bacterium]|jgi:putative DNA primase/helicase
MKHTDGGPPNPGVRPDPWDDPAFEPDFSAPKLVDGAAKPKAKPAPESAPRAHADDGENSDDFEEADPSDASPEQGAPSTQHGPKAEFRYNPTALEDAIQAAERELDRAGDVYSNGSMLVQVIGSSQREQEESVWVDSKGRKHFGVIAGSRRILPMTRAVLLRYVNKAIQFKKFLKKDRTWVPIHPPEQVISALHEAGAWNLSTVRGISETPILRPDGTIAQTPGFDRQSGYFIEPNAAFQPVADRPTVADAKKAYAELAEVFEEFPFAQPGSECIPIAAILSIMARPAIRGSVPGFAFDAPMGGAGKTLLTDAISLIATGRTASRLAYPKDDEEMNKVFSGYAIRGTPMISVDDIKRTLGGEVLDMLLTSVDTYDFRRLGKTETLTLPWRAVMTFTGVNLTYMGQMNRRLLVARIEPKEERPQDRQNWKHPKLLEWIGENRLRLVAAALTMLRAYTAAERPGMKCGTWGSFEPFAAFFPSVIRFAGGPNLLDFRLPDTSSNEDNDTDYAIVDGVRALCLSKGRHEGMTANEIGTELFDRGDAPEFLRPLRDALQYATMRGAPGRPTAEKIGRQLHKRKGKPTRISGRLMKLFQDPELHARLWRVVDVT